MRTARSARTAATLYALKPVGSLMSPYVKGVTTAKACTPATQRPYSAEACALYGFI